MLREGLLINKHMALRGFRYVTMSMSVVSTAYCSGLLLVTREPTRSLAALIRIMVVYKCTAMLISNSTSITYRRAPSPHPLRNAKLSRRHVVRISTSGNIKRYIKGAGRTAVPMQKKYVSRFRNEPASILLGKTYYGSEGCMGLIREELASLNKRTSR
jgi:hypothetical protein